MVGFLAAGFVCFAAAIIILLVRRPSIDARVQWYEQHWPLKWKPSRAFLTLEHLFGAVMATVVGVLLIIVGIMKG